MHEKVETVACTGDWDQLESWLMGNEDFRDEPWEDALELQADFTLEKKLDVLLSTNVMGQNILHLAIENKRARFVDMLFGFLPPATETNATTRKRTFGFSKSQNNDMADDEEEIEKLEKLQRFMLTTQDRDGVSSCDLRTPIASRSPCSFCAGVVGGHAGIESAHDLLAIENSTVSVYLLR